MNLIDVASPDAPELKLFSGLTDAQLRSRQRPEEAVVIAEGPKVVRTALDRGLEPLAVLMRRTMIDGTGADIVARVGDTPVVTGGDDALAALTGFRLQRAWVLCAFRRPPEPAPEDCLRGARRVAYLEGLNEPSNVGAIFRSAAALGMDALLLSPDCADPWHRRAVRVCMGAVFTLPFARVAAPEAVDRLRALRFTTVGLALRDPCLDLRDPRLRAAERAALFFGTEDTGLTDDTLARMDHIARIPMARGIDSLNVAAAAAIAFWALDDGHLTGRAGG